MMYWKKLYKNYIFKSHKLYIIITYLKTDTLHYVGEFLKFFKKDQKTVPTHEGTRFTLKK